MERHFLGCSKDDSREWINFHQSIVFNPTDPMKSRRRSVGHRENEMIRKGLTWCMRYGISKAAELHQGIPEPQVEEDYQYATPIKVSSEDPSNKIKQDFIFKSHAPRVFKHLRSAFGVDDFEYVASIVKEVKQYQTSSKSGGFFFFTGDGKYLIKTATIKEFDFFKKKLCKSYYTHMTKYTKTSLLTRFMGFYELYAPHLKRQLGVSTTRFIVMRSVYSEAQYHKCHRVYDLKGSRKNRARKGTESVYKDNDALEEDVKFRVGRNSLAKHDFEQQLHDDVRWLKQHDIMDYSLLVGVHDEREQAKLRNGQGSVVFNEVFGRMEESVFDDTQLSDQEDEEENVNEEERSKYAVIKAPDETYYMAIIDILTEYTFMKKVESFCKENLQFQFEPSAVNPFRYGERFEQFVKDRLDIFDETEYGEEAHI